MTFAVGHVEGGTGAGRRIVKPTPKPWECRCPVGNGTWRTDETVPTHFSLRQQPAYLARCTACGTRRPR